MNKTGSYIIILLFWLSSASAQDLSVSIAFDTTRILIGDQINFTLTVKQPEDLEIQIPVFRDTIISKVEIVRGPERDTIPKPGGQIDIIDKYLVTSFDSGMYEVEPVYIEIKKPDGINRFFSDYALLEVIKYRVAPADTAAGFYDIIPPYEAPLTFNEVLPWLLIALLAAAVIWFIIFFIRKFRKKEQVAEIPKIIEPAHIIAFRELEMLKNDSLKEKGEYKQYFTRLTEILRSYLENRYGILSLELTTTETLQELLRTGFKKGESYDRLRFVLTTADFVKFAKYIPVKEDYDQNFDSSWQFIEETKEIIDVAPTGETRKEGKV